ncbi:flavin-containing monooxygenase [Acrocarpospora pleiomorpha]|uniref:flavin-containing monooxygenase n=1 Tax=Acrocarpospora pleiomorpha TaxID=90975 RepID=UPI0012D36C9C|nr:NAD(P)/FAD-dependent oxidoreductase [Acrocarpospora pleiomorpha]
MAGASDRGPDHEFIVIGAGLCGLYALHRLLETGRDVIALEAHPGLGGTWYKNRYPGCRFDSESYTYGYSFSADLLQEWDWSEHFAAQPETLRYLNHVADRFHLRRHIRFDSVVRSAVFDDHTSTWTLELGDGQRLTCRFLLTALGLLSAPMKPRIPGIQSFRGVSFHTYDWPEGLDLTGKRVGVIGTGSTGVQIIAELAGRVAGLDVFQLKPNWCAPLNNSPIGAEEMAHIKASYDEIFARCAETPGGFIHGPDRRPFHEVSREERLALWERLYASPGFGIWLGNFRDILLDEDANREFSDFVAGKIRERVHDPVTAEKLIPRDHGFGVHRVPLETGYYEAYNHESVRLVDLEETPIVEINETGVATSAGQFDLDVIVYATGFDAITGSYDRIDFRGRDGVKLRERWADGPTTYLGALIAGFPNLVMLGGPHSASVATNFPRAIETSVDWAAHLFAHVTDLGCNRLECEPGAEKEWTQHIQDLYQRQLLRKAKSWFTGYNPNIPGHDRTRYLIYTGGAPRYRRELDEVAGDGYRGLVFSSPGEVPHLTSTACQREGEQRMRGVEHD